MFASSPCLVASFFFVEVLVCVSGRAVGSDYHKSARSWLVVCGRIMRCNYSIFEFVLHIAPAPTAHASRWAPHISCSNTAGVCLCLAFVLVSCLNTAGVYLCLAFALGKDRVVLCQCKVSKRNWRWRRCRAFPISRQRSTPSGWVAITNRRRP